MANKNFKNLIDQSWQLRREKRFSEAELLLYEALPEYDSGSFEYNTLKANLADVLLHQGNIARAHEIALEVLAKAPDQATALTVLGIAALENKSAAEAVENLQKAYYHAPNPYRAGRLARALESCEKTLEALELLREALQRYSEDAYLLKQYSNLQRRVEKKFPSSENKHVPPDQVLNKEVKEEDFIPYAEQIKYKLDDLEPEEAARQLQKIIKVGKRKKNPHLHLLLGDFWRKAGHESKAAESYWKARELDPENLLALSQLLFSYRRMGKKEEAWPLLKMLLDYRPTDKTAKSSLIKDAVDLNKEQETILFFEELIQKYPRHKEFYGAIRKLKTAAENKSNINREEY